MHLNPNERDAVIAADWLELETVYSGENSLSFEALRAHIAMDGTLTEKWSLEEEEVVEEVDDGENTEDFELGAKAELLVGDTIAEIDRRDSILGEAYPFERSGRVLSLKDGYEKCVPYIFCLLVADREYYSPTDVGATRLFEHLVVQAVASYIGGTAIRFGSPRDTMPSGVQDAINELSNLLGDERIKQYPVNDTDKDLGLDVVGWRDFPDRRISKLELFVQCATGEDWGSKRGQCDLHEWQGILWCAHDRFRGLAIPYVVADDIEWRRSVCGLLFMDRVRISSVIRDEDLPDTMWKDWCAKRIAEVNRGIENGEQAI